CLRGLAAPSWSAPAVRTPTEGASSTVPPSTAARSYRSSISRPAGSLSLKTEARPGRRAPKRPRCQPDVSELEAEHFPGSLGPLHIDERGRVVPREACRAEGRLIIDGVHHPVE